MRAYDAHVGARGEYGTGGAEEMEFDASRRRVRLRGRDQETGQNFGVELYLWRLQP
jgi:hypothetical protein